jgi:hypothetical protein
LPRLVESLIGAAHDGRVTAPSAPGRSSGRLLFRLAVIVASVVAAIVGSVLLVTQANGPTGSTAAPVLPPGGKVVARIRIGRASPVLAQRSGGPLAVGEGAVWAMSDVKGTLMRIDPARNAVVARIKVGTRRRPPLATAPSGSPIRP